MKKIICVLLLASTSAFAAAPDSIGGKVYRDMSTVTGLGGRGERTILFGNDGRFNFLISASVSYNSEDFASGRVLIRNPPGDGTFVYVKTTESTATVDLSYDDSTRSGSALRLTFTSASAGNYNGGVFALSDVSTFDSAPAVNISTRGHVAPGQPLIVGFVVPGTRGPETGVTLTSPDANQRGVLVRVVGPSLAQFGVMGLCADPDFKIYRGSLEANSDAIHYGDWSIIDRSNGGLTAIPNTEGVLGFKKIFGYVSAFPLIDGSKDAAQVIRLGPGAYTVVAAPAAGDPGGEVLVEVYFLP